MLLQLRQLFAQQVRLMRVYEGPTEVHRMAIAKRARARLQPMTS